jgi:hypothetical protein
VSKTKTVITRHRGDGRAIRREIADFDEPLRTELEIEGRTIYMDLESVIAARVYGGNLHENMVQSQARQLGKSAALGIMYGHGAGVFQREIWMDSREKVVGARNPKNGPFRVERYNARTKQTKYAFKVVNAHGYRVHRGGAQSCCDVCATLNTEYAKHLMLKE